MLRRTFGYAPFGQVEEADRPKVARSVLPVAKG